MEESTKHRYKIPKALRKFLNEWAISLEGCLAILVMTHCKAENLRKRKWGLINSETGGIYIEPYVIKLYEDHAEVISPKTENNVKTRDEIENILAVSVRGIIERVSDSMPGYEGLAMLSYVEDKARLSKDLIARLVTRKGFSVINPKKSPLIANI
jgi:hypothetical protein